MQDINDIEEIYDADYEKVVNKYKEKLRIGKNKVTARDSFKKDFKKILNRRNKDYSRYLKNNKDKLFEVVQKKKIKEEKKKTYKSYHVEFGHNFFYRFNQKMKFFSFKFSLIFRSIKYNIIPSWLKFAFFRIGIFFSSLFVDVKNFFRGIKNSFGFSISRMFSKIKKVWLKIKNNFNTILNKIKKLIAIVMRIKPRKIEDVSDRKEEKVEEVAVDKEKE